MHKECTVKTQEDAFFFFQKTRKVTMLKHFVYTPWILLIEWLFSIARMQMLLVTFFVPDLLPQFLLNANTQAHTLVVRLILSLFLSLFDVIWHEFVYNPIQFDCKKSIIHWTSLRVLKCYEKMPFNVISNSVITRNEPMYARSHHIRIALDTIIIP